MKVLTKASLFMLAALCTQLAQAEGRRITRSENIGKVQGILITKGQAQIAEIEIFYQTAARNLAELYGFEAEYPLTVGLGDSGLRTCQQYSMDKSYSAEEFLEFHKQYGGLPVELQGVQRHYGVAGRAGCTFTGFNVLDVN